MAYVAPAVLLLSVFVAADLVWAELRDRRARRLAIKRGSTLTRRFGLPLPWGGEVMNDLLRLIEAEPDALAIPRRRRASRSKSSRSPGGGWSISHPCISYWCRCVAPLER